MSDLIKTLTINRFQDSKNIPIEILDIIKSFSMYDLKTWIALKDEVKNKKKDVCEDISVALSRSNRLFQTDDFWDECWTFYYWLGINSVDLTAKNCKKCGNYKESRHFEVLGTNLKCVCLSSFHLSSNGILTRK